MKKIWFVFLCLLITGGCAKSEEKQELSKVPEIVTSADCPYTFDVADFYTDYDHPVHIQNTPTTISQAGTYLLSGSYTHGVVIDAADDDMVRLVLDNAVWENMNEEAIKVKNAKRVLISLPEGTTSTMSSADTTLNHLIDAKTALVFNGEGTLKITANNKDAIQADDELVFISGHYDIEAIHQAVQANQTIAVYEAVLKLKTTEGDALQLSNELNDGLIYLQNGTMEITTERDGISVDGSLVVSDGSYTIRTVNGNELESQKGIKASTSLRINGGTWQIETIDDAIHSNQDCQITAGTFQLTTQGKGVHADAALTINSGLLQIENCEEGLEAKTVTIHDGNITITALDDGINATDINSTIEMGAQSGCEIIFNGGKTIVYASGDGLDSNDKITVNGGEIYVYSDDHGDASLDYESQMIVNGGTLIACGYNQMAVGPTSSSTQASIALGLTEMVSGDVSLIDAQGLSLASWSVTGTYNHIVISTPQLQLGNTYTCTAGDISSAITIEEILTVYGQHGGFRDDFGGDSFDMPNGQDIPEKNFKPENPPLH